MIYTVTLNPSVDYFVQLSDLKLGEVNRVVQEKKMPGGKGINVSRVLRRLQISSQVLGFIGGFTGDYIKKRLMDEGIPSYFIEVQGETRINVKVKAQQETEINGEGPQINPNHMDALLKRLALLEEGDCLVLSGSVPKTIPNGIYEKMIKQAGENGAKTLVDTTGTSLKETLAHHPFLVKPNHHELNDYYQETAQSVKELVELAKRLLNEGPENVLVSMGGEGALLVNESGAYLAHAPAGDVQNSVGAGDSLVAGFLGAYSKHGDLLEAFQYGVAAGSATAFSMDLCTQEKVESLYKKIEIQAL
ncbi:1-phosphofructokinase [Pullulanibacillus sp. KACC 23026]|uniref:1-phosphofructokinase n=1 Tax=Pullulanibacillus sp. KACC 23026 TaxID=3028315 RepID=UPI0023B0DA22|nr:1-phosphofructokinase [Pullulanibacillus sp. KACC 23026]WEG13039.1 1-phosphofructokinase [Pullulanibacillus sp. KACC 23026]